MRIDKLLGNMGFGSRKDVKLLIKKGHVTVNDQVIKNNGTIINPESDIILVNHKRVYYQQYVYLMMNKAPGFVSATEDKHEKTVIDLLSKDVQHFKVFPVGRLDKDTEGLLLLTNDGELSHQLTSPKKDIPKTYYAKIKGTVTEEDVEKVLHGIQLADGHVTKPAKLKILRSDQESEVEITITEGKYHQVKRMFAALGMKVDYLKRISMGQLVLDQGLSLGAYRELTPEELAYCLSLKS
jgi:16S rRNA pseudouridine516 synthase